MRVRYFFDVQDGDAVFVDATGTELTSLDAARHEAVGILQDLVRDEMGVGGNRCFMTMARTAEGTELFRAILTIDSAGNPSG